MFSIKLINFNDLLIFHFRLSKDFFASSGVFDFLIIFITLSRFSTETDRPINMWPLSSAFFNSNLVFFITTSSLNFRKFSKNSLREIFDLGLPSIIAKLLNPNELSIEVYLYSCLLTVSGSTLNLRSIATLIPSLFDSSLISLIPSIFLSLTSSAILSLSIDLLT